MTTGVTAGKSYVTAFLNFKTNSRSFLRRLLGKLKFGLQICRITMIHLNGDKFLGPR